MGTQRRVGCCFHNSGNVPLVVSLSLSSSPLFIVFKRGGSKIIEKQRMAIRIVKCRVKLD
jgi:hypothetical protein